MALRNTKRNIIVLTISIFIFAGILWYATTEYESIVLRQDVARFIIPPVTFENAMYDVENGNVTTRGIPVHGELEKSVLRLARFSIETRINPLFGLEGTDLLQFQNSIEELKDSAEKIAQLYEFEEANIIRASFYPIAFLRELHKTEKLRREFAAHPSDLLARRYHSQLMVTLDRYLLYLESLFRTL